MSKHDDDFSEIESFNPDKAIFSEAVQLNKRRQDRLAERRSHIFSSRRPPPFKAGQNVRFVVEDVLPEGCEVTMLKSGLPAFIQTKRPHSIGEVGIGIFVCVQNGLCYLSEYRDTWVSRPDDAAS